MAMTTDLPPAAVEAATSAAVGSRAGVAMETLVLTGGFDKPYAYGLVMALAAQNIGVVVVGSDEVDCPEFHGCDTIEFRNLHGNRREDVGFGAKALRVLSYYSKLFGYTASASPQIFHILWNNKFQYFDRTLLMAYYKLLGKKTVLTAHNINAGKRDGKDSFLNRLTLRMQYRAADQIFVHTEKMKSELIEEFGVANSAVTVIPFGINNAIPHTDVTPAQAKRKLGIAPDDRTILFFGNIGPYKGLDFLLTAFQQLLSDAPGYRLIIAGKPRGGCEDYVQKIRQMIEDPASQGRVLAKIEYIADEDAELYFKAADVLALPYTEVSQSGVLFLGYSFGLPVVATDVGSFRDDVIEGRTGLLCNPFDATALANAIHAYFGSELFRTLDQRRQEIREFALRRNSWDVVGRMTKDVYTRLLGDVSS